MIQKNKLKAIEADHRLALLKAAVEASEKSQARIAKDLHDDLGALLSTVQLHVSQFGTTHSELPDVAEHTANVKELLSTGVGSVRRIVNDLMPPTLRDFGLKAAVAEIESQVNKAGVVTLEARYSWDQGRLDATLELPLFRISQELVNNTLKHAEAKQAKIHIMVEDDFAILEYGDDGKGFDNTNIRKSHGLTNIESRATLLGGSMEYETAPQKGFRATITVPIPKTA
jgi:signal transduction histidine kinase